MFGFKQFLAESKNDKVLVISFSHKGEVDKFMKDLNAKVTFVFWRDLVIMSDKIFANELPLEDYKFILCGVVGEHMRVANVCYTYIKHHKIPYLRYGNILDDKMIQTVKLSIHDVPQIKTIAADADKISASKLIADLGLPIVVKKHSESEGRTVEKLDTKKALEQFLSKNKKEDDHFIFQTFIENDGDYRLLFVRDKLVYTIKRVRKSKKDFRNNTALGADWEFTDLPADAVAIARKAHKKTDFDISGVDLVLDKVNNKWLVIEVNNGPQFFNDKTKIELVLGEIKRLITSVAKL